MRVYVSIDLEGVAGVFDRRQVARGTDDYPAARDLMAGEANAVIAGAVEAGADEVVVNDSHGDLGNLRADSLDPRALLQSGSLKSPHAMVHRADEGVDLALFVGYHAAAGTSCAVMDHTYSSATVGELRVNGRVWGEAELNAAVLGAWGVPVGLVAGDDAVCDQVAPSLPWARLVRVKTSFGNRAARSLSPQVARELLRRATAEVVAAPPVDVFRPEPPFRMEIDFLTTAMTDVAAVLPYAERTGPRTLAYPTDDVLILSRARAALTGLAAGALTAY